MSRKTDETSTSGKLKLLFIEVEDEEAINSVNDKVTLGVGGWRRGVGGAALRSRHLNSCLLH